MEFLGSKMAGVFIKFVLLVSFIAFTFAVGPLANGLLQGDYHGFVIKQKAPEFLLTDASGETVSQEAFDNQWVYLIFGYLRCPNICHSQVAIFDQLSRRPGLENAQFVYLAMDAVHDQPSVLREYFDKRGNNFLSLHGDSIQDMQSIASQFNAAFQLSGEPGSDEYLIDHPSRIFLMDPDGYIRLVYTSTAIEPDHMAMDFNNVTS